MQHMWAYCGPPDPLLTNFTGLFMIPSMEFLEFVVKRVCSTECM